MIPSMFITDSRIDQDQVTHNTLQSNGDVKRSTTVEVREAKGLHCWLRRRGVSVHSYGECKVRSESQSLKPCSEFARGMRALKCLSLSLGAQE
jgi:hypothetical protein